MEILEGTWEEIRTHDAELAGRKVTVIVRDELVAPLTDDQLPLPGRFARYVGSLSSGRVHGRDAEEQFGRLMQEKQALDRSRRKEAV